MPCYKLVGNAHIVYGRRSRADIFPYRIGHVVHNNIFSYNFGRVFAFGFRRKSCEPYTAFRAFLHDSFRPYEKYIEAVFGDRAQGDTVQKPEKSNVDEIVENVQASLLRDAFLMS